MPLDPQSYHQAVDHYSRGQHAAALAVLAPWLDEASADPEALNLAAMCEYAMNRMDRAEACWQRAIAGHPHHTGAYNNLGNLYERLGRRTDAEAMYRRSLELNEDSADAHYNLGNVLAQQDRLADAERSFRSALELRPDFALAHNNLANLLARGERVPEAEAAYRRTLAAHPGYADAHNNLGNLLAAQERFDEAATHLQQAVELRPDWADVHVNLGRAFAGQKRYDDAEREFRAAIGLNPRMLAAHQKLIELLDGCGRFAELEHACRHVADIEPGSSDAFRNLGTAIYQITSRSHLERMGEAEAAYRRAIALQPEATGAYLSLGDLLQEDPARIDEAIAELRQAFALGARGGQAQGLLGTALLRTGRYAEGWPLLESRYDGRWEEFPLRAEHVPYPQWRGESLVGKSLLVVEEQGFGDTFQFCRYLSALKLLGPAKIAVLWMRDDPLYRSIPGVDASLTHAELPGAPPFDYWCFLMSLPALMRTTLDTIPRTTPYLFAADDRIEYWRKRLPSDALKVGIAWMGEPRPHLRDDFCNFSRRWASARDCLPLLGVPGVRFVNLQKGASARQDLATLPSHFRPLDPMDEADNFADTAAIIACLDLVITIDTSIAHLAGALGKPVWILLSSKSCWRWLLHRDDSPWYPTARLFRQTVPNQWDDVIERVVAALTEWRGNQPSLADAARGFI
ncbi:TPR domain-containing protein [Caballeronia catudaia]|uniref:TPR domain-containing protein n=1 Tax=Caballeronia catudaia TaxID=1777136 RepID=A0A158D574_9BURK|nr:tetratricopeptide repeat protein [Caballeronia catudaia]SAK89738.1 TPR domain-containing protein [Caballeronia catudaia]